MKAARTVMTLVAVMIMVGPALADWDPGDADKMHWPQLPDLGLTGVDVLDGPRMIDASTEPYSKYLADDFLCTETGPITEIHIWSSYNFDIRLTDASTPIFNLAIYSDIPDPDGSGPGYSMPGTLLWSDYRVADVERLYAENVSEQFYDPNEDAIIGFDTKVWQYNFKIPEALAFEQKEGTVYWLGINRSSDINGDGPWI